MRAPAAQLRPLRRGDSDPPGRARSRRARPGPRRALMRRGGSMPVLIALCLLVAAISPGHAVHADLRPVGLDHVGPRDRAPRPGHRRAARPGSRCRSLFTTPFSLFGRRRGALPLADRRPRGRPARRRRWPSGSRAGSSAAAGTGCSPASFAALALFSSFKFVRDAALGNSEALLAALVLWAFERHLDGRRDHALYLGVAARAAAPRGVAVPRPLRPLALVRRAAAALRLVVLGALVPALWFLPEWWGSGDPLRAGAPRQQPEPGQRRLRRPPGARAAQPLPQGRDRARQGRHHHRLVYALVLWVRHRREGADAGVSRSAASPGSRSSPE